MKVFDYNKRGGWIDRKKEFIEKVDKYKQEQNIQVKCEADKTKLYLRYILDKIAEKRGDILPEEYKNRIWEVYNQTRGNQMEINILIPSTLAMTVIHYVMNEHQKDKRPGVKKKPISMVEIGRILGDGDTFSTITTGRANIMKLEKFLNKNKKEQEP